MARTINKPEGIDCTSSIRGTLAYTWFHPTRDFSKFYIDNQKAIKKFAKETVYVDVDELDDFLMTYLESAYRCVWNSKPIYPNELDSDQEFIRRVKNRLWSFCSAWLTKKARKEVDMISLDAPIDEDSEESYVHEVVSPFTLEHEINSSASIGRFFEALNRNLDVEFEEHEAEMIKKVFAYRFTEECTIQEALRHYGLTSYDYYMHNKRITAIMNHLKPQFIQYN